MNRIVIIGNGFDLAHGLKTSYPDVMSFLFDKIWNESQICEKHKNFKHLYNKQKEDKWIGLILNDKTREWKLACNPNSIDKSVLYKNLFKKFETQKSWGDIERHYFDIIRKHQTDPEVIEIINEEFSHFKAILNEYLINEIENKTDNQLEWEFDNPLLNILKGDVKNIDFEETYFISFNYTSTLLLKYLNKDDWFNINKLFPWYKLIHIHGKLGSVPNPIIFGYGDDDSPDYQSIKNQLNNNLLTYFKTFQYLRSTEYKQVLSLLANSKEVYLEIIGHSCDIGDKTLLKTIFEHPSIKFIESLYYDSERYYFENLHNISRIFDSSSLMRDKIVPLQKTRKMPQVPLLIK
jgi:hypothetical protein